MSNVLLWAPLAFGLLGLFLPRRAVGWCAVLGSIVTLGVAIAIVAGFDSGTSGMQYLFEITTPSRTPTGERRPMITASRTRTLP